MQFQTFDRRPYLERLRSGDFRTQEHFVAYFSELIHLKLRVRLHSPQDIEDVRQETFARVCNRHAVGGERCFYSATDGRVLQRTEEGGDLPTLPCAWRNFPCSTRTVSSESLFTGLRFRCTPVPKSLQRNSAVPKCETRAA